MIHFTIIFNGQSVEIEHPSGPFELGRGPQRDNIARYTVNDSYVSGNHVRVEQQENSNVRILNLSQRNSIRIENAEAVSIGSSVQVLLPVTFFIGETTVRIDEIFTEDGHDLDGESEALLDSMQSAITLGSGQSSGSLLDLGQSPSPEKLAVWFETLIAVQKSASGSLEFFQDTAKAVVNLIGLDRGLVLMIKNGRWMVQSRFPDEDVDRREFSMSVLSKMVKQKKTFFQSGSALQSQSESVMDIQAVIASPIFDKAENVVGSIYGVRNKMTAATGANIGVNPLEAQIVQLLASSVGAGLARQAQEAEAGRLRVQFEQFFLQTSHGSYRKTPNFLRGMTLKLPFFLQISEVFLEFQNPLILGKLVVLLLMLWKNLPLVSWLSKGWWLIIQAMESWRCGMPLRLSLIMQSRLAKQRWQWLLGCPQSRNAGRIRFHFRLRWGLVSIPV